MKACSLWPERMGAGNPGCFCRPAASVPHMAEDASRVLSVLGELAPLELAEDWDSVGLIVDARSPVVGELSRVFLTVDLTLETLEEACTGQAELIVAYHPPIFGGLKRLRRGVSAERLIVLAIERGLAIYSPHTALDAAEGGMAEWLAAACGAGPMRPIAVSTVRPDLGAGRIVTLEQPLALNEAVARIKRYLGLAQVRLATPDPALLVRTLAVCPGAGGALFQALPHVDLLLTGEMRHHDVLARRALGTAVVLTDHTNCERGYLPVLAARLRAALPGLDVLVSSRDADPLGIV